MRVLMAALCVLCFASSAAQATTYMLWPNGTGDFPNIQAAVDAAVDGDIIQLGDGTFQGPGDRDIDCFYKGITIRSRYGDPRFCIVDCEGAPGEGHRGFRFQGGFQDATLEGITVRGASLGAILVFGFTDPQLRNCILEDNRADNGGAILCVTYSHPQITDCILRGNAAGRGGAVYCRDSGAAFTRCTFEGNSASVQGGAVWCVDDVYELSPTFERCTFRENHCAYHGGALYCDAGSPRFSECTFVGNAGEIDGGAASMGAGAWPGFANCTLFGNRAGRDGSGLCAAFGASPVVRHTIIAFGLGASAVYCDGASDAHLDCCDIFGNEGGDWVGAISEQYGIDGNISADPLFCDPVNEDFTLEALSPCAPDANPACGLIGAWPVACSSTPAEYATWGSIKAMFRR